MGVDLQADVLAGDTEPVQQGSVVLGGEDRPLPRVAAQGVPEGGSLARAKAVTCEGWSLLAGICTASWPVGVNAAARRAKSGSWSGTHWMAALEKTRS